MGSDLENKFKEHLMGHKATDLSESYKQTLKKIKQVYKNWKPLEQAICIDCEIYDNTDKEILNLKDKYEKLVEKDIEKDKIIRDFAEILQGIKPFLAMEYEKALDEHKIYRYTTKLRAEYEKPETNYQNLKKVMNTIDDFVKEHQKKE